MTDRPDDILLTAYALGELDDAAELARVEQWIAEDESAARQAVDLRLTAAVLTEGLKGEPDVGLTAIHYAGIERRLAADAASDAPQPIPIRRNWGLWGSVAASTLVVATLVAGVLPNMLNSGQKGPGVGGGKATGSGGAGDAGNGSAVSDGGSFGGAAVTLRPGEAGAPAEVAGDPTDWPMLRTSAGGLPWPAATAPDTGLREPSFVVAEDFSLAMIPPTPAYPEAGKGAMSVARSAMSSGKLPSPQLVRTDELINAIRYDDAPPADGPVSATIESAVCPWDSGHFLVRVVVRSTGKAFATEPAAVAGDGNDPATAPSIAPLVRDLRLAVEVNPAAVSGYKVIGYENAPRSWGEWAGRNDLEIFPAGKTFTVLLEVVPAGTALPAGDRTDVALKYRRPSPIVVTATEMLTVGVEYRQGPAAEAARIDLPTSMEASAIELASPEFRTAAAAAALGNALRHAKPYEIPSLEVSLKLLADVTASAPTPDRQMLLTLAKHAEAMNPNPKADPTAPMPGPFEDVEGK